jgi:hypothetical protein
MRFTTHVAGCSIQARQQVLFTVCVRTQANRCDFHDAGAFTARCAAFRD